MAEKLDEVRGRLDIVDRQIVQALAERDRLVAQVATVKRSPEQPVRDVAREESLLGKVVQLARDEGLSPDFATRIFRDILDHSLRRQHRRLASDASTSGRSTVVAFQGTRGSYSHQAASRHFASADFEAELVGFHTFKQAIDAVASGDAEYGVLPIENTTAGSINDTYDLLAKYDLHQIGEEVHRIEHCLLALEEVPVSRIRRIYSQAQALWQCTEFLDGLDHCQAVSFTDTALSCAKIRDEQDLSQAAIASEEAGRIFGLTVIQKGVADNQDNFTRFAVIAREPLEYDLRIPCKTSMIFSTRHEQGALLECLNVLARHGLNMTKLESRPRPNVPWQYLFYVDIEGNSADGKVQAALHELRSQAAYLRVLGSYPARTTEAGQPAEPRAVGAPRPAEPPTAPQGDPERLVSRAARAEDTVVLVKGRAIGKEPAVTLGADDGPVIVDATTADELKSASGDAVRIRGRLMHDQALLKAAGRVDRPVVLDRSPMASIDEWLSAAEVILQAGNQQVILCECGIRTFETATAATLDIAGVALLKELTHLPVLVDPAGAGGDAGRRRRVTEAALAAGASGVLLS